VNAVTLGDFEAPLRISIFAKEVFTGFSMVRELLQPISEEHAVRWA
jgi:hypothetical protein